MTTLPCFCHSRQSAGLVLGPESGWQSHPPRVGLRCCLSFIWLELPFRPDIRQTLGQLRWGAGGRLGGGWIPYSAGDNTIHGLPRSLRGLSGGITGELRAPGKSDPAEIPQQSSPPPPPHSEPGFLRRSRRSRPVGVVCPAILKAQYRTQTWGPSLKKQETMSIKGGK